MSRRRDIEFLRIIATFLVVWYHCPSELPDLAYSGLIFFIIASTYFSLLENSSGEYVSGRRVGRLLSIWLIWYLVYAVISAIEGKIWKYLGEPMGTVLLVGPAVHLWYLPFLAAILIASMKVVPVLTRPPSLLAIGIFFAASMLFVDRWRPWAMGLGVPWAQYVHAVPAIVMGVLFAAFRNSSRFEKSGFLLLALSATLPAWHAVGVGATYFAGVALAAPILLAWREGWLINKVSLLSKYMLGIYLIHQIVIRVVRRLLEVDGLLLAALTFLASLIVVAALFARAPRLSRAVM